VKTIGGFNLRHDKFRNGLAAKRARKSAPEYLVDCVAQGFCRYIFNDFLCGDLQGLACFRVSTGAGWPFAYFEFANPW